MIKIERLKNLIEKDYASLNKAAADIGISPATLSRLINGKRDVGRNNRYTFSIL